MKRQIHTTHTLDDPALAAMTATEAVRYGKSRKPEDLGTLDGDPIVFHFRRLTRPQLYDFVESTTSEMRKMERAFMAAVVRIEGGVFGAAWEPEGVGDRLHVAMSEDEIEALEARGLSIAAFVDVGQVAYIRSILGPKAEPAYPLPPSSLLAWDAHPRRSAEPSQDNAPPSSEARSAA